MTLFDVNQPSVKLRTHARAAEQEAARKAVGRAGSWRRRIFNLAANTGDYGITSIEVAHQLAQQTPCQDCGCEHRPPIPVNQIASRLQELREWGYLAHKTERGEPVVRSFRGRTGEVHYLTHQGWVEWRG